MQQKNNNMKTAKENKMQQASTRPTKEEMVSLSKQISIPSKSQETGQEQSKEQGVVYLNKTNKRKRWLAATRTAAPLIPQAGKQEATSLRMSFKQKIRFSRETVDKKGK